LINHNTDSSEKNGISFFAQLGREFATNVPENTCGYCGRNVLVVKGKIGAEAWKGKGKPSE